MKIFPLNSLLGSEFDKIKQLIEEECIGLAGKKLTQQLKPTDVFIDAVTLLEQTEEFKKIISNAEPFQLEGYPDVSRELKLLGIRNSVLNATQLMQLYKVTAIIKNIFDFFKAREDKYLLLQKVIADTDFEHGIINEIDRVLDDTGVVRSNASPELASIRKSISRKRSEADQVYNSVMNKYRKNGWLTDAEESWRNGRRVISIVAEHKRSAKGIIHDLSATGKTCYIEPEETIVINNQLYELAAEEQQEIFRILKELTEIIRKFQPVISRYAEHIAYFDFTAAKARLAIKLNASLPFIEAQPHIDLREARHPLLYLFNKPSGKMTIPFDLKLNDEQRILVISGPNAGGKTVCMKTVGLLQMMLQSGLLTTADENSRFGFFKNIMVDIGDSQSLEYELSTYSSRLKHMRMFLQRAGADTLFLIDEFGTGTDPNLGGALAEAILEELNERNAFGIITTHYMNLKVMADRTPGIINGSMAFDAKKLEPQFRLEVGKPGSSYTFIVAERSGLPFHVIKKAKKKVKSNSLMLEQTLNKMEQEKSELNKVLTETKANEKQLQELMQRYQRNLSAQEEKYSEQSERIRQKELRVMNQLEEKFKKFVHEWKLAKNKKDVLNKYNAQFNDRKKILTAKEEVKQKEILKANRLNIKRGSSVRLRNGRVIGIVEQIKDDKAEIRFGNVKTIAELTNLVYIESNPKKMAK